MWPKEEGSVGGPRDLFATLDQISQMRLELALVQVDVAEGRGESFSNQTVHHSVGVFISARRVGYKSNVTKIMHD